MESKRVDLRIILICSSGNEGTGPVKQDSSEQVEVVRDFKAVL